jgi:hypothetical protein
MSYSVKGKTDTVTAASRTLDAADQALASATVSGRWILLDNSTADQQALAKKKGAVSFTITSTQYGPCQFCVTDVVKVGYVYDPSGNGDTCQTLPVP